MIERFTSLLWAIGVGLGAALVLALVLTAIAGEFGAVQGVWAWVNFAAGWVGGMVALHVLLHFGGK